MARARGRGPTVADSSSQPVHMLWESNTKTGMIVARCGDAGKPGTLVTTGFASRVTCAGCAVLPGVTGRRA